MKKIVGIFAGAAVLASSVFAVDFSARTVMNGDVLSGDKDGNVKAFTLNKADQKDGDALVVSANTDNAGAKFQLWYTYGGDADAKIRNANVWFKPVDSVKVTLGSMSTETYKEKITWWKGISGTKYNAYWNGYSAYPAVEGEGLLVEYTGIENLTIAAGVAPGAGNSTFTKDKDGSTYNNWGAYAKYNNIADLPLSVAVSFRDAGTKAEKILAVGADYGNMWGEGFYGFLNARLRLNEGNSGKLDGIAIDNFFKYSTGAFKATARVPVTIRLSGEKDDPNWLLWDLKLEYAMDGFTPYAIFGTDYDGDNAGGYTLDSNLVFFLNSKVGVTFNVGACALDLGVKVKYNDALDSKAVNWSVPFSAAVAF